ncbi:MAG: hypothetical protein HC881_03280 [Leptolyngbyaceae cyanobacterium SL_7_1]|nr:hypothetical protein [Leptolyngbyaceae cyanobacterium SL_7_1]
MGFTKTLVQPSPDPTPDPTPDLTSDPTPDPTPNPTPDPDGSSLPAPQPVEPPNPPSLPHPENPNPVIRSSISPAIHPSYPTQPSIQPSPDRANPPIAPKAAPPPQSDPTHGSTIARRLNSNHSNHSNHSNPNPANPATVNPATVNPATVNPATIDSPAFDSPAFELSEWGEHPAIAPPTSPSPPTDRRTMQLRSGEGDRTPQPLEQQLDTLVYPIYWLLQSHWQVEQERQYAIGSRYPHWSSDPRPSQLLRDAKRSPHSATGRLEPPDPSSPLQPKFYLLMQQVYQLVQWQWAIEQERDGHSTRYFPTARP